MHGPLNVKLVKCVFGIESSPPFRGIATALTELSWLSNAISLLINFEMYLFYCVLKISQLCRSVQKCEASWRLYFTYVPSVLHICVVCT
jgi:hypothetical protein